MMLGVVKRRCHGLLSGLLVRRGIVTHHQQSHGGSGGGGGVWRQKQATAAPASAPTPVSAPPEKEEWWVVDGELFKAEKFDPKAVLAPLENEHIPNKRRRKELIKHLALTRLKIRAHGQETYWAAYMRRYQILRSDWEKLVWDPKPEPALKTRKASLVAKDAEKYVWRDPQRDAYVNSLQTSRMDSSRFKAQDMDRYPFAAPGRTGFNRSQNYSGRDSVRSPEPYKDEDVRHRTVHAQPDMVRHSRDRSREEGRYKPQHQNVSSSDDEDEEELEGVEFSWDEDDSARENDSSDEDEFGTDDQSESDNEVSRKVRTQKVHVGNEREFQSKRRGSYRHEEKDEDDSADEDEFGTDDQSEDESSSKVRTRKAQGHVGSKTEFQSNKRGWYGHEDDLFKDDDD